MISSNDILEYYNSTANRDTRDDLKLAVNMIDGPRIAIDCGCGAGSDIAFLRANGFLVHAFDIESEAILRCQKRFGDDRSVRLSQAGFSDFDYPAASLILADASLFFCPESEFGEVWRKMTESLLPNGIFVGSFLGEQDTMAAPGSKQDNFWPDVLVLSEEQIRLRLDGFEIISFTEHKTSGETANGKPHHWHIFSVVARKEPD